MKIGDKVKVNAQEYKGEGVIKSFVDSSGFVMENIDSIDNDILSIPLALVTYIENSEQKENVFYIRDLEYISSSQLSLYVFPEFMSHNRDYSGLTFAIARSEELAKEMILKDNSNIKNIFFGECEIYSLDQECCWSFFYS